MTVNDDVVRGLQATIAALRRELADARQTIAVLQRVSGWAVSEPPLPNGWTPARDGGQPMEIEV